MTMILSQHFDYENIIIYLIYEEFIISGILIFSGKTQDIFFIMTVFKNWNCVFYPKRIYFFSFKEIWMKSALKNNAWIRPE